MISSWLLKGERDFRWRGEEISRTEAFSDGVFAFTVTLLIVSLEVPKTFSEMKEAFIQLPVFAVCFTLLMWIWHCHYTFHRRYGLEDAKTIALNATLLFLVMFYAFPLKFLFNLLFRQFFGFEISVVQPNGTHVPIIANSEVQSLMLMYSAGFSSIFLIFTLLYWNALRLRKELELTPLEVLLTKMEMLGHLLSLGVGLVSLIVAAIHPKLAGIAGVLYCAMGPLHAWHGWRTGKLVAKYKASVA